MRFDYSHRALWNLKRYCIRFVSKNHSHSEPDRLIFLAIYRNDPKLTVVLVEDAAAIRQPNRMLAAVACQLSL